MKQEQIYVHWLDDGPSLKDENEKISKRECQYLINDDELNYCCNKKVFRFNFLNELNLTDFNNIPNNFRFQKLLNEQWKDFDVGLCKDHIDFFNKKYKIHFIEDLVNLVKKDIGENNSWELKNLCKNILEKEKFSQLEIKTNNELRWIDELKSGVFPSVPFDWLSNYKLFKYNGKSTENQGVFNGPDFIFINDTKKYHFKIGFEVVAFCPNLLYDSFKQLNQAKKYAKEKIYDRDVFDTFEDYLIQKTSFLVENKINKSKKYEFSNELFLGIILNNVPKIYHFFLLRIILYKKYKNPVFNGFVVF